MKLLLRALGVAMSLQRRWERAASRDDWREMRRLERCADAIGERTARRLGEIFPEEGD